MNCNVTDETPLSNTMAAAPAGVTVTAPVALLNANTGATAPMELPADVDKVTVTESFGLESAAWSVYARVPEVGRSAIVKVLAEARYGGRLISAQCARVWQANVNGQAHQSTTPNKNRRIELERSMPMKGRLEVTARELWLTGDLGHEL
jgi:hypothetical protein